MAIPKEQHDDTKDRVLLIANKYILEIRKWEPDSYTLRFKGVWKDKTYGVSGFKLEDIETMKKLRKSYPKEGELSAYYPSEFIIFIDLEKGEVIKDIRPGSKEENPRP